MSEKEENISMRYWEYFCALESDLKKVSRYIDFSNDNLDTHSIELTRFILSSCSEIDVILKEICFELDNTLKPEKINEYQKIIKKELPNLINEKINIGFSFPEIKPWDSWNEDKTPDWWAKHNKVKHQRNKYYKEANLDNAIKAITALFICINYYYKIALSKHLKERLKRNITFKDVTQILSSDINFIRFSADYYISHLRID
ncbi:hypothetical protein BFR04_11495 [Gaetbulibacter sp. 4G1]|nr:hypothetical protein [Gaetbulibacter sp. 4G1]PIA82370.1 hypothetical protein BFR04_11495 [Gaetbulibacter sp. 4G1]